jgi:hypothetical protein
MREVSGCCLSDSWACVSRAPGGMPSIRHLLERPIGPHSRSYPSLSDPFARPRHRVCQYATASRSRAPATACRGAAGRGPYPGATGGDEGPSGPRPSPGQPPNSSRWSPRASPQPKRSGRLTTPRFCKARGKRPTQFPTGYARPLGQDARLQPSNYEDYCTVFIGLRCHGRRAAVRPGPCGPYLARGSGVLDQRTVSRGALC